MRWGLVEAAAEPSSASPRVQAKGDRVVAGMPVPASPPLCPSGSAPPAPWSTTGSTRCAPLAAAIDRLACSSQQVLCRRSPGRAPSAAWGTQCPRSPARDVAPCAPPGSQLVQRCHVGHHPSDRGVGVGVESGQWKAEGEHTRWRGSAALPMGPPRPPLPGPNGLPLGCARAVTASTRHGCAATAVIVLGSGGWRRISST